jgi:hypothetical protein
MFTMLNLWQRTRTKCISLLQAGYTHHDAVCKIKHGVSNYSSVAQSYRLANLLTEPLSYILCVPSLQTTSSMIIIKPLLFQQKLEHIPALGSETGDFRCAWRSLRTRATNINHLTPNDHFSGRTAPLTYRCCIFFYLFNRYTYWIF